MGRHPTKVDSMNPSVRRTTHAQSASPGERFRHLLSRDQAFAT